MGLSASKRPVVLIVEDEFLLRMDAADMIAGASDLETEVLQREERSRLATIFTTLPAGKRELLVLRFASGLTVREIAAVTGLKEGTVKVHLFRALRSVRAHVGRLR